jgi:hypothetical protein
MYFRWLKRQPDKFYSLRINDGTDHSDAVVSGPYQEVCTLLQQPQVKGKQVVASDLCKVLLPNTHAGKSLPNTHRKF